MSQSGLSGGGLNLASGFSELAEWAQKALKRQAPPTPTPTPSASANNTNATPLPSTHPIPPPRPTRPVPIPSAADMDAFDFNAVVVGRGTEPVLNTSDNIHFNFDAGEEDDAELAMADSEPNRLSPLLPSTAAAPLAVSPTTGLYRVIRFRVIKLSKNGLYVEKIMSLDPLAHLLLFQDPSEDSRTQPSAEKQRELLHELPNDREKGFRMSDIQAFLPYDDQSGLNPSAPISIANGINNNAATPTHQQQVSSSSLTNVPFASRLLVIFHPELVHRSYELLFQDAIQRNIFLALVQELYGRGNNDAGIEIMNADEYQQLQQSQLTSPVTMTSAVASGSGTEKPGPRWVPDSEVDACPSCNAHFTLLFRKHHCRSCGSVICQNCSDQTALLPELYAKPVRVCDQCFNLISQVRRQGLMIAGAVSSSATIGQLEPSTASPSHAYATSLAMEGAAHDFAARAMRRGSVSSAQGMLETQNIRPAFVNRAATLPTGANALQPTASEAQPVTVAVSPPPQLIPPSPAASAATPARDIYGFLLSSPTLALAAVPNQGREHSVLHVSSNDESRYESHPSPTGEAGISTIAPSSLSNQQHLSAAAAHQQAALLSQQQHRLAAQHAEFEASRARWNKYLVLHTTIDRNSTELKRLVRRGIPPELRGQVWQILSGSREKQMTLQTAHARRFQTQLAMEAARGITPNPLPSRDNIVQPNYYEHCLACSQNPANLTVSVAEIEKDLLRTFPDNVLFESVAPATPSPPSNGAPHKFTAGNSSAGLNMLRRVLLSYSFHNPSIGYCQSMNFITALLLLFMDEQEAFYLLAVILEDICCIEVSSGKELSTGTPSEYERKQLFYHSPDLAGAHIDSKVLMDLIAEKLPKVHATFHKLTFPLAPLTMNWLLLLFVNTLPLETTLIVWDILLSEGPKILFRAALTLIKVHEKPILKAEDFEELLLILKTCPAFHSTPVPIAQPVVPATAGNEKAVNDKDKDKSTATAANQHHHHTMSVDSGTAAAQTMSFLPAQTDTSSFIKLCFDPLWLGRFPMTRITALRSHHRLQVEEELEQRKLKMKAAKAAANKKEKERKQQLQQAQAASDASVPVSAASSPASKLPAPVIEVFFPEPTSTSQTATSSPNSHEDFVSVTQADTAGSPHAESSITNSSKDETVEQSLSTMATPKKSLYSSSASLAAAILGSPTATQQKPARPAPPSEELRQAFKRVSIISSAPGIAGNGNTASGSNNKQEVVSTPSKEPTASPASNPPTPSEKQRLLEANEIGRSTTAKAAASSPSSSAQAGASSTPPTRRRPSLSSNTSPNSSPLKVPAAAPVTHSPPSLFGSMMSSVGNAFKSAVTALTEDERKVEENNRKEREEQQQRRRSASLGSGTPPKVASRVAQFNAAANAANQGPPATAAGSRPVTTAAQSHRPHSKNPQPFTSRAMKQ